MRPCPARGKSTLVICLLVIILTSVVHGCSPKIRRKQTAVGLPLQILQVSVVPSSFNPTRGETVEISYRLTRNANVTMNVFDPDHGLVKTLIRGDNQPQGMDTVAWDGRDADGTVVPDQAYYFVIEAKGMGGDQAIYDPTAFSGGEEIDIADMRIDDMANTISFRIPEAAWVLGRAGIKNGPLLKTLVDWEPRREGENTVFWNGKDESDVVELVDQQGFSMMITTMLLPDNSVIAVGNKSTRYREYKTDLADRTRPADQREVKQKPEELAREDAAKFSTHRDLPRYLDRAPGFSVSLPNVSEFTPDGIPIVDEKTLLKVVVDEEDLSFLTGQRYEIAFYVDFELYAEEEEGYSPFNWMWDTSGIPEGEHVLTVNVVSLNDQVGARSLKFFVEE